MRSKMVLDSSSFKMNRKTYRFENVAGKNRENKSGDNFEVKYGNDMDYGKKFGSA